MIAWLETKLSRWGAVADEPDVNESTGEVANSTQDQEPEKGAPMPDIYADEHGAPAPDRSFLDPSPTDADKTTGFNPYDTAKMHKK